MKKVTAALLLVVLLLASLPVLAQPPVSDQEDPSSRFADVSGHWAQGAIKDLLVMGAIPYTGDSFAPEKAVTRSELAVMLHKALGIQVAYFKKPDIEDYFTDVQQDASYASALIDLVTVNILEGQGSYRPDDALSREELVHYIMNAYRYKMGQNYKMIKLGAATFADSKQITPPYSGDVARAAYHKLVRGRGDNLFYPQAYATRAEAAAVITNLLNLLEKEYSGVVIKPSAVAKEDSLEMKLRISNFTDQAVTLTHPSGQQYDFVLLASAKQEIYTWSADKSFMLMITTTVIQPGETLEFTESLEKDRYLAIKDQAVTLRAYLTGSSEAFTINPEGYEFSLNR